MQITLGLVLPRDGATIPLARHISRYALAEIGVSDETRHDIEVALTEACTNVLEHSGPGDAYEVELSVREDLCYIRVIDRGHGFDTESLATTELHAERGRGVNLMRALVDRLKFESRPEAGTIVHLEKRLDFADTPLRGRAVEGDGGARG